MIQVLMESQDNSPNTQRYAQIHADPTHVFLTSHPGM